MRKEGKEIKTVFPSPQCDMSCAPGGRSEVTLHPMAHGKQGGRNRDNTFAANLPILIQFLQLVTFHAVDSALVVLFTPFIGRRSAISFCLSSTDSCFFNLDSGTPPFSTTRSHPASLMLFLLHE